MIMLFGWYGVPPLVKVGIITKKKNETSALDYN
jgi:hypothetical protein